MNAAARRVAPESGSPRLTLRLAGSPMATLNDEPRRLTDLQWLVLLSIVVDPGVDRSQLIERFWPGSEPAQAKRHLRVALSKIRSELGEFCTERGDTLRLAGHVQHDVNSLAARCSAELPSPSADEDLLAGVALTSSALATAMDWLDDQRRMWSDGVVRAIRQELASVKAQGCSTEATQLAMRLIAIQPGEPDAYSCLLRLHLDNEQVSAAASVAATIPASVLDGAGESALGLLLRDVASRLAKEEAKSRREEDLQRVARAPLVGRQNVLDRIRLSMADRRNVLILGEWHVGKSRLLGEVAAELHAEVKVRFEPRHGAVILGALDHLISISARRPLPEWTMLLDRLSLVSPVVGMSASDLARKHENRLEIHAVLDKALLGRTVAIDDLHAADDVSLELLVDYASAHGDGSARILATADERRLRPAALDTIRASERTIESIRLLPWTEDEARQFLARTVCHRQLSQDEFAVLYESTGGSPGRVVRGLSEWLAGDPVLPLSVSLEDARAELLSQRLGSLSDKAQELIDAISLLGLRVSVELLSVALSASPLSLKIPLRELRERGFVGRRFELLVSMHDSVIDSITAATRQDALRRVYEYLVERRTPPSSPLDLAAIAGDWARAAAIAGDRATEARAWQLASDAHLASGNAVESALALAKTVAPLVHAESSKLTEVLRALAGLQKKHPGLTEIPLAMAEALNGLAQPSKVVAILEPLWTTSRESLRPSHAVVLASRLGYGLANCQRIEDALRVMSTAEPELPRCGNSEVTLEFLGNHAVVFGLAGRRADAAASSRRAVQAAEELERFDDLAMAKANQGIALLHTGAMREALSLLLEASRHESAVQHRGAPSIGIASTCAALFMEVGEVSRADRMLREVLAAHEGENNPRLDHCRINLALVCMATWRLQEAERLLGQRLSADAGSIIVANHAAASAEFALLAAQPIASRLTRWLAKTEGAAFAMHRARILAVKCLSEPPEKIEATAEEIVQTAERHQLSGAAAIGLAMIARAHLALDRPRDALRDATDLAARLATHQPPAGHLQRCWSVGLQVSRRLGASDLTREFLDQIGRWREVFQAPRNWSLVESALSGHPVYRQLR